MRALILVASTGLLLAACKDQGAVENAAVVGDNLAAEAIIANDTTAIDAATGDASNMAADVAFDVGDEQADSDSGDSPRSASRPRRQQAEPADDEPAAEPAEAMETATENEL